MRNVGIAFAAILAGCGSGNMNNDEVSLPYTVRVSETAGAKQADAASSWPSISADGRYVAFSSTATNLVPGDTNDQEDVFVKDLQTGAIVRASTSSTGAEARGGSTFVYGGGDDEILTGSSYPTISADGRYVAFQSFADDLLGTGGDTNERSDIFVKDLVTGKLQRVSVTYQGQESQPPPPPDGKGSWNEGKGKGGAMYPSISADGRYVAFESHHRDLVAIEKTQGVKDIYVRDLVLATTTLVSMTYDGQHPVSFASWDCESSTAAISADGRFVAFQSNMDRIIPGVTWTGGSQVYARDLKAQVSSLVSVTSDGLAGTSPDSTAGSYGPRLSADGRFVTFVSQRSMVPGVPPYQIYLRDRARGTTVLVSQNAEGIPAAGGLFDIGSYSISGDGRYVAFAALSPNLVPDDLNDAADVFVRDVVGETTLRVSVRTGGEESQASRSVGPDARGGPIGSMNPAISADGRFVAFQSDASNLVGVDTNGASDIFIRGPLKN